jgi:hypothetical protein
MRVFHALLSHPGTRCTDLGADWYDDARQAARRLAGALGAMGYEVTLCRKPAPGPEAAPQPDPLTHTAPSAGGSAAGCCRAPG